MRVKAPWLTLLLGGSMLALFAGLGPAPTQLVYDRTAILGGEWWRLVTAHLVHSDVGHLAWNLGGLLLLGGLLEGISRAALSAALAIGTLAVDLVLLFGLPGMGWYCGLSGSLNALLVPLFAAGWAARRSPLIPLMAALTLAKIGIEMASGQALFTETAWASVPQAHLAGWLAGIAAMLLFPLFGGRGLAGSYNSQGVMQT